MQCKRQIGQHLMPTHAVAAGRQRIGCLSCPSIGTRGPDVVRRTRVGGTVGKTVGLAVGLAVGLVVGLTVGLTVGLRGGLHGAMGELVLHQPGQPGRSMRRRQCRKQPAVVAPWGAGRKTQLADTPAVTCHQG